jgi:hypothetical protein
MVVVSLACMHIRISQFQDHHVPTKLDKDSAPHTRKATREAPRPTLDAHKQHTQALLRQPQLRRTPRTRLSAASALHQPRRAPAHCVSWHDYSSSGCLSTSSGSSCGSSSTTSPTPHVRVPRHVAPLVAPLVVDYSAYATRPGALACRAAHHAARRTARRRLLRLRRASGCLGTSRHSSRRSSSTTPPTPRIRVPWHIARLIASLVVDYSSYAARPGASAHRATHRAARRRLLRLHRTSGCLGSSRGSSSTTSCAVTSSRGHTDSTSAMSCVATTCLAATVALLRVRRALPRRRFPN